MQSQLQLKPSVAVITAAGPIMQSGGGSPGAAGEGMVESHKLVRVLRAMRENPQVTAGDAVLCLGSTQLSLVGNAGLLLDVTGQGALQWSGVCTVASFRQCRLGQTSHLAAFCTAAEPEVIQFPCLCCCCFPCCCCRCVLWCCASTAQAAQQWPQT
jgi:hypothetical protein